MRSLSIVLAAGIIAVVMAATDIRLAAGQRRSVAAEDELDQAERLLRRREYFQALARFRRANELDANRCAECVVGMAQAMLGMKAYPNALETTQMAIGLAQDCPRILARAHGLRAEVFQAMAETDATKYQDAEAEFRLASGLDPEDEYLHYGLGMVLLKQGREADGLAELRRFLEIRDEGAVAQEVRSILANPRRAREAYIPEFSVKTVEGQELSPEALRGKVVLFDFWASWCPPCVDAVPALRKLQQAHAKDPFVIVGVSADEDDGVWRRFTVKNNMVWPQFWDSRGELRGRFGVNAFPTYVLVDRDGIERMRVTDAGFHKSRALNEAIEKELAKGAAPGR